MGWGKRVVNGTEFDLTHLDSKVVTYQTADGTKTFRVLVNYGLHCFARDKREGDHPDALIAEGQNTVRCICPIRTEHSKQLPRIVREAAVKDCYWGQDENMLLVEEIDGMQGPYAVFFTVRRSPKAGIDVTMFVATAYEKPKLPERLAAVPFLALIAKAANGHKPFKPKKLKVWKKK